MLLLTKADMEAVFTMREAFDAVREAFTLYTAGQSQVPLRSSIDIPQQQAQALFMPAYAGGALGIKIVGLFPNNRAVGMPVTPATMLLFDENNGALLCMMDGAFLTQTRTAAAAGLATELLASPGAEVAALIGLGGQAPCQFNALLEAAPTLREVRVFDLDSKRKQQFADERSGSRVRVLSADTADQAVSGAHIVTTVTTATAPVFSYGCVAPGMHINAIGSFTHDMQELPEQLIASCDLLVFDTVHGVMSESGDILKPLEKGMLGGKGLDIEMGHVLAGAFKRKTAQEVTVYKSVGSGVLDVVTAAAIYKKAIQAGLGQKL